MQINSEQEYQDTLAQIEVLMDAREGTPEAEELERLAISVEKYEKKHFPIAMSNLQIFLHICSSLSSQLLFCFVCFGLMFLLTGGRPMVKHVGIASTICCVFILSPSLFRVKK